MTSRKTKAAGKRTTKKTGATTASNGEGRLRVRMYRVGFGDFFLIIVPTSAGDQHILIDCGVFKGTSGTGDIGSIVEAVEDMFQTTNGHLALVIMTHRHADHIAGFSKAERFKDFTAGMVWMPYWEQFNDDKEKGAAHNLQLDIHNLAADLAMQFRGRADDNAKEALAQLGNATGIEDFNAAATSKKRAGGNAAALDLLKNHLGSNGEKVRYYAAGDKPELPDELEGLKATILGPPPEKAKAFLALMDLKKGVGQYLDSLTDGDDGPKVIQPFSWEWTGSGKKQYPRHDVRGFPVDYDQFIKDVNNAQPDMLAAAAEKIENFLNNQSLVVLFEFDGKKLLFAGDAQGGNWEYWLFKTEAPQKDPTKAGDIIETSKELLQTIDFYKVGHHGSTNATPIQVIEAAIARPKTSKGFVSMCSTEDGVYGNPKKETEVPRTRLMEVLEKDSCLVRSDAIAINITDAATKKLKTIAARDGVKLPKPKVGKLSKARLYLEYSF
jgi:beta-lactamase superfamily II metal-dependent hydrolase